jgi:hypothetical protein
VKKLRYGVSSAGVWIKGESQNEPGWYIHRQMLGAELTGSYATLSVVHDVQGRTHFTMQLAGYKQTVYRTPAELARRHWERGGGQNGV